MSDAIDSLKTRDFELVMHCISVDSMMSNIHTENSSDEMMHFSYER